MLFLFFFFFQAEDGIRDLIVTGVQTCALPISIRGTFFRCRNLPAAFPTPEERPPDRRRRPGCEGSPSLPPEVPPGRRVLRSECVPLPGCGPQDGARLHARLAKPPVPRARARVRPRSGERGLSG